MVKGVQKAKKWSVRLDGKRSLSTAKWSLAVLRYQALMLWRKNLLLSWTCLITLCVLLGANAALLTPIWGDRASTEGKQLSDFLNRDSKVDGAIASSQSQLSRPVHILVMGIDPVKGSLGNYAATSDTMLLLRLNPDNQSIKVLSIPRDSMVVIPEVGLEKIMVMQWLNGLPLLSAKLNSELNEQNSSQERGEITSLLFRAFFQQVYIDGFFHADPHPGNLFYLKDGRVALLDCGMVGRLDPRTQQILTEMLLAIVDLDAQRCSQLTLQLADSAQPVILSRLENDYDRMLRKYYNLSLSQINFSQVFYEVLQVARNNKIRLPSNLGLYAKTLANLEGVTRKFNPEVNLLDEIKPLITDLFRRQLFGTNPLQSLLRTALDVKSLSLQSPRHIELLLDRVTSETLQWNLSLRGFDGLRRTVDDSANRLSFSILVGSMIMGAAIISSNAQTSELSWISSILFAFASLLGLWLIFSTLRSGRLR